MPDIKSSQKYFCGFLHLRLGKVRTGSEFALSCWSLEDKEDGGFQRSRSSAEESWSSDDVDAGPSEISPTTSVLMTMTSEAGTSGSFGAGSGG
ncbi:hypothetical protein Ahia01_000475800 [Argonauta hians]